MDQFVPFGSGAYFVLLTILLFSRGMDVLSTWIGTPNLTLEANRAVRFLGWRRSIALSIAICFPLGIWLFGAIILSTVSLLVAARNFQNAWMMRTMGEAGFAALMRDQLTRASPALYNFCMAAQCLLTTLVAVPMLIYAPVQSIVFAVGCGICSFALAQLFFCLLSMWRIRRA